MTSFSYSQAAEFSAATLHEASAEAVPLPAALRRVAGAPKVCGRAFTVSCPPGDNLWIHRAILAASPGDVLVCVVGDAFEHGYWGEILTVAAMERGIAGLVIDGGIRDTAAIDTLGFPVFARMVCIRGTTKLLDGAGALGEPIRCGDALVNTGDLIVGDCDGLVAVPEAAIERALLSAAERDLKEIAILDRLRTGETTMDIYGWGKPGVLL